MPSKRRHPRHRRPIALTSRDTELLRHLAAFGVLSTDQIRRLCFRSVSRARRRLNQLWQHAFIRRSTRPVRVGEGTSPYIYSLAGKGRETLARAGDLPQSHRAKGSLGLHASLITDLRITFLNATQEASGLALATWRQGKDLWFQGTVTTHSKLLTVPIVPDAFFILHADGKDFAYFLEVDRGTTDLGRLRSKFLAYIDLWQNKSAQTKLGIRSFRILYVTTSETRLQHLLGILRKLPAPPIRRDIIACTSFSRVSLDEPIRLFTPIWVASALDGTAVTVQPLPPIHSLTLPIVPGKSPVRGPDAGAR